MGLVASVGDVSLREVLSWSARQISITRVYWRNLWRISGGTQILYSVFLVTGTVATAAGDVGVAALLGAVLLLGALSGSFRNRAIRTIDRHWSDELRGKGWIYVLMGPFVGLLTAYGFLRSALSRRIRWRGKTYEMRSPTETVIVR